MFGRSCDNCGKFLTEREFHDYGSWSYTCEDCGFTYVHGSGFANKQVEKFRKGK